MKGRKCARSIGEERQKAGFEGRNEMKEVGGGGGSSGEERVSGGHVGSGGEPGLERLKEGKENVGVGIVEAEE